MKNVRTMSKEANQLRVNFQNQIVEPYICENGSLKGYKTQLYLLLPRFNGRIKLYKGVDYADYSEFQKYLSQNQSQRRFENKDVFQNQLDIVKSFEKKDLSICFERVWHNGVTEYIGEHWKAQALALRKNIKKYGFTYFENDYNFASHLHSEIETANPFLVKIYEKIIHRKMMNFKIVKND